jgi:HD superfamily phosphodiesterase
MNTNTAQEIAQERNKFMQLYLEQFFAEWSNNK